MAGTIPRPGVEVIQTFRTVSPTIITPTLVPAIVGVCKQIVNFMVSDGAGGQVLNNDALVSMPGIFFSRPSVGGSYGGLHGLTLTFTVNDGPDVVVTFSDPTSVGLSPASIVDQVNAAMNTALVSSAVAYVSDDGESWYLATLGVGEFQYITIKATTSPAVISAFECALGFSYVGKTNYDQYITGVPFNKLADPRDNIAELAVEQSSVQVFLGTGSGGYIEADRNSAFLRRGIVSTAARTTEGSVNLTSAFPTITTQTLIVSVNGGAAQTVTLASPANVAALLSQITSGLTGATPSQGTANQGLVLTSTATGPSASIAITGGTVLPLLGITAHTATGKAIAVVDDGNGDLVSPLIKFEGHNFTTTPTAVVVLSSAGTFTGLVGKTITLSTGGRAQTITFSSSAITSTTAATEINAVLGSTSHDFLRGGYITAADASGQISLTHSLFGTDSYIEIVGGTAVAQMGLAVGKYYATVPGKPRAGDQLYVDGSLVGTILQVAPGGATDTLRVNVNQTINANAGTAFYIQATSNLDDAIDGRPNPQLIVENGFISLKQELLRDIFGAPVSAVGPIYASYSAVRRDVTSRAAQPGLLTFNNTTSLEDTIAPISTENPLALGMYFALLNAPAVQVSGLGVDSISADSPYGTVEAFTKAAEYLEAYEVYAIAPLTHDETVHQVFATHVTSMSSPELKGERVVLVNPAIPLNKVDRIIASGVNGQTVGAGGTTFDTKISALTALVQNAGITASGTIPISAGLFLDIGLDAKHYSIQSISGAQISIRTSFTPGTNDDNFYATTDLNDPPLPSLIVDASFSIRVRGGALVTAQGRDLDSTVETIATANTTYLNRRVWSIFPDAAAATIGGLEQRIDGFYVCAALAGMVAQNPPQQSFTNFPITGFTKIYGSNDTFNERQLDTLAGGGTWIVIQEAQGAALISRMALTTDTTSIETRTDSITKAVDYTAKYLRRSLKNFIGRFNITQGFFDTLSHVIEGIGQLLIGSGTLAGFDLEGVTQDEANPDTVLVTVILVVLYPANRIRLTLVV